MGNVLNSGENNDDLVDIQRLLGYIKSKKIERVFRAVDRGDYVLASHRDGAWKDVSWKIGNIHLSAPCVYSKVMEGLSLESGQSFLNLGSGTGYLSTMAGLILNHHGTNHGIELHKDCLDYAYERLEEFKQKSLALDEFDFCEPVFIHGNCLRVVPNRQYDRVYCGAACPESHEAFIKQFVKVGGILVMPYKDHLLRIERVDTDTWRHKARLPVAFASLVIPKDDDHNMIQLPFSEPLSLQELCRCCIRSHLRSCIWSEHPELATKDPITSDKVKKPASHGTFPLTNHVHRIYGESDNLSSGDEDSDGTLNRTRLLLYVDAHPSRAIQVVRSRSSKTPENLPDLFERSESSEDESIAAKPSIGSMTSSMSSSSSSPSPLPSPSPPREAPKTHQIDKQNEEMIVDDTNPVNIEIPEKSSMNSDESVRVGDNDASARDRSCGNDHNKAIKLSDLSTSSNGKRDNELKANELTDDDKITEKFDQPKKKKWRKLQSTDDNNENEGACSHWPDPSSSSSSPQNDKIDDEKTSDFNSLNSSSDDESDETNNSGLINNQLNGIRDFVFSFDLHMNGNDRVSSLSSESNDGNNDGNRNVQTDAFANNVDINTLSQLMKNRITQLPLPISLQLYINYNRTL